MMKGKFLFGKKVFVKEMQPVQPGSGLNRLLDNACQGDGVCWRPTISCHYPWGILGVLICFGISCIIMHFVSEKLLAIQISVNGKFDTINSKRLSTIFLNKLI